MSSLIIVEDMKMKKLYCDMDGVLVDFVAGATKLVNNALENPESCTSWKEYKKLKSRLKAENRDHIKIADLEKPEYRGISAEEVMPEARAFMKRLIAEAGKNWWASLPWMPGGKALWAYLLKHHDPHILSAPMSGCGGCKTGKLEWISANLGVDPRKIILTDEKYILAKNNVLIDDFEINTVPWKKAGGLAIKHVSAKRTITKLKEVGEDAKF